MFTAEQAKQKDGTCNDETHDDRIDTEASRLLLESSHFQTPIEEKGSSPSLAGMDPAGVDEDPKWILWGFEHKRAFEMLVLY